ncbi:MAG: hypothetical protein WCR23_06610 [Planctomycetota bacterium]
MKNVSAGRVLCSLDQPEHIDDAVDRSLWPVWKGHSHHGSPALDLSSLIPSERIELVWEISKNAWPLSGATLDESSLFRDVTSVTRRGR